MVQSNTLYAPKTGLYLPGTNGNYVSTPDNNDLDITGDLCLMAHVKLDRWIDATLSTGQTFIGKLNTAGQRSYRLGIETNGKLNMAISSDLAVYYPILSSIPVDLINNKAYYIAGTFDSQTISNNHQVTFWISENGLAWDIFDVVTLSGSRAIAAGSAQVEIGGFNFGTGGVSRGTIYSAQIYDGIGDNSAPGLGTLVAEADFTYPWVNNKYTDATGKVWTINGSAWAWEYQDDPEDKYTPTPEIWGGDAYQLIDDQINNSSSALHVLNGGNARGY